MNGVLTRGITASVASVSGLIVLSRPMPVIKLVGVGVSYMMFAYAFEDSTVISVVEIPVFHVMVGRIVEYAVVSTAPFPTVNIS